MMPEVKRSSVPLAGYVILGKALHFSVPLFLNVVNGNVMSNLEIYNLFFIT